MNFVLILFLIPMISPPPLFANEPTFERFFTTTGEKIDTVTSNAQAETLISSAMDSFQTITSSQKNRRREKAPQLPESVTKHLIELATEIASWHFAVQLETLLNQEEDKPFSGFSTASTQHLKWLKQESQDPEFHRVIALVDSYEELAKTEQPSTADLPQYAAYTQFLYNKYLTSYQNIQGLLTIAEKEGAPGLRQRLYEFWTIPTTKGIISSNPTPSIQESYSARYIHQYYLPLHKAYLLSALAQLQIVAERHARENWEEIQQWHSDQQLAKSLMRLCGTWQWLIHNHQNHGDHKTVMIYPPPSQYDRMDPKPAKIHVQGDTIYIRWEFPRGIIQEESLLFSERDQVISGTFVNNLGPNGNITGRRVKPCQEK